MKRATVAVIVLLILVFAGGGILRPVAFAEEDVLVWQHKFEGEDWSSAPASPLVIEEMLIVFSGTKIYKLNISDGSVAAEAETGYGLGFGIISPSCFRIGKNYRIVMAFSGGTVACYDYETLEEVWHYTDESFGKCNCPVIVSKNTVYTGFWTGETTNGNFVAINALNGALKWKLSNAGGFYWTGAAVVGDKVIVGGDDGVGSGNGNSDGVFGKGKLFCLNSSDGAVIDVMDVVGDQRSQITYLPERGEFLLTSKGGYLYSVMLNEAGRFVLRGVVDLAGEQSTSQPMVYNGRIYVCSGNGINKGGCVEVLDLGTLSRIYLVESDYYPQSGVALVPRGEAVDVYYNYNGFPGGIRMFTDTPDTDANAGRDYFVPDEEYRQYCIGFPNISGDRLIYKNDSCTVFCIAIEAATETVERDSVVEIVNSCTYGKLMALMRTDVDELDTEYVLKLLYSSQIEYGSDSDYAKTVGEIYALAVARDAEVRDLSERIKNVCADITSVTLSSRGEVLGLYSEFTAMSEGRRGMVQGEEDLMRAYDKVNTLQLAMTLGVTAGVILAAGVPVYITVRGKIKAKKRAAAIMPESDE